MWPKRQTWIGTAAHAVDAEHADPLVAAALQDKSHQPSVLKDMFQRDSSRYHNRYQLFLFLKSDVDHVSVNGPGFRNFPNGQVNIRTAGLETGRCSPGARGQANRLLSHGLQ